MTKEAIGAFSSMHAEGASLAFYTFRNEDYLIYQCRHRDPYVYIGWLPEYVPVGWLPEYVAHNLLYRRRSGHFVTAARFFHKVMQ